MLGVPPFVEDPDLLVSAARALAQHLPPWKKMVMIKIYTGQCDHNVYGTHFCVCIYLKEVFGFP